MQALSYKLDAHFVAFSRHLGTKVVGIAKSRSLIRPHLYKEAKNHHYGAAFATDSLKETFSLFDLYRN